MSCNKFVVKMKKCLVFFPPHWLSSSQSPLLASLFLPLALLRTLFLALSSFYSHIFDDSFQSHGFQFHLYAIASQICISSPGLFLELQTYFQLPNWHLSWISNSSKWTYAPNGAPGPSSSILFNGSSVLQLLHSPNLKSDPWHLTRLWSTSNPSGNPVISSFKIHSNQITSSLLLTYHTIIIPHLDFEIV